MSKEYKVTVEENNGLGCGGVFAFIVILLVVGLLVQCGVFDSNPSNGAESNGNYTTSTTIPDSKLMKLSIDPYSLKSTSIKPYNKADKTISSASFKYFSGTISQSSQKDTYSFTTNKAGVYRIELSNMVSGFKVSMFLYDSNGSIVDDKYSIGQGNGVTVSLNANSTYKLVISSSSGTGSYKVFIGEQKSTTDITGYTTINDSMEFSGQQNNYSFTPSVSGVYRFHIAQINSGIKVSMFVYDEAGYIVDDKYSIGQDNGVTVTLKAGKTYSVRIQQSSNIGNYTLAVGYQKATTDITGYTTINDSMEFSGQQNNYSFTPSVSGVYRFHIAQINSGIKVSMFVYDEAGYIVDDKYSIGQDNGVTVTLKAGKTYSVRIQQSSNIGNYTLGVGYQKKTTDISNYDVVVDSIQFSGQENKYTFKPTTTGQYTLKITDIASGTKVSIYVYDSAGYKIGSTTSMSNGSTLKVNLNANSTYSVVVQQYSASGNYNSQISK